AQPRVSARERTMMVGRSDGRTVGLLLLLALCLPSDGPTVRRSVASLTIGRLHYDGGGDWYSGPSKLVNLLGAIRQRTRLAVSERERVVTLTSPGLWDVPYLYMTGHGNVRFADEEVPILRRYLEQGGFLHADDDYGMDKSFRREIARVFPDHPLVEVPLTHPIYHVPYEFPKGLPKIHEHDGLPAQGFGIFLGDRLVVYYSYQTDLGDGWEDPEVHHDTPELHGAAHRARRTTAPPELGRLAEREIGGRAGSVVGVLAPPPRPGVSAALLALADARAATVVERAAPGIRRALARGTRRGVAAGVGAAALGGALFVASAPASGRAAAFWHPLRTLAAARTPVRLWVDRATVRRGDSVTVTVLVPAAAHATLETRAPGEPWHAASLTLDSVGRAVRRIGPLEADL